MQESTFVNKQI